MSKPKTNRNYSVYEGAAPSLTLTLYFKVLNLFKKSDHLQSKGLVFELSSLKNQDKTKNLA